MGCNDVVLMASQMLEVLEHIHCQGVIHCDISPANILISDPTDEQGLRYILCDFGASVVSPEIQDVAQTLQTKTFGLQGMPPSFSILRSYPVPLQESSARRTT